MWLAGVNPTIIVILELFRVKWHNLKRGVLRLACHMQQPSMICSEIFDTIYLVSMTTYNQECLAHFGEGTREIPIPRQKMSYVVSHLAKLPLVLPLNVRDQVPRPNYSRFRMPARQSVSKATLPIYPHQISCGKYPAAPVAISGQGLHWCLEISVARMQCGMQKHSSEHLFGLTEADS